VLALAKLEKERVLWTKKLLAMGQELPEEMALTYIEYKNNILLVRFVTTIEANEKEFDKVKEMIDKLRASPLFFRDFTEMRLKEQHRAEVEDQTILSFSVVCNVSKGGTTERGSRRSRSSRTESSVSG
jgi:Tfp pilus assembly protein PilN